MNDKFVTGESEKNELVGLCGEAVIQSFLYVDKSLNCQYKVGPAPRGMRMRIRILKKNFSMIYFVRLSGMQSLVHGCNRVLPILTQ